MKELINESVSVVQVIQLMLAPGLMISACGLLLLGINNKYSIVVNRIRLLNQERRELKKNLASSDSELEDNVRLESTALQIQKLLVRIKYIRNAVLSYSIAIALFVLTSLLIGYDHFYKTNLHFIEITTFLAGMISVFCGVVYTGLETTEGYKIIQLEIKADE